MVAPTKYFTKELAKDLDFSGQQCLWKKTDFRKLQTKLPGKTLDSPKIYKRRALSRRFLVKFSEIILSLQVV